MLVVTSLYQSRAYYQEIFLQTEGLQVIFDLLQKEKSLSLMKDGIQALVYLIRVNFKEEFFNRKITLIILDKGYLKAMRIINKKIQNSKVYEPIQEFCKKFFEDIIDFDDAMNC